MTTLNPLIVIPTFNNKKTVAAVVDKTLATGLPVLIVNDGSTDGSLDLLKKKAVFWISCICNRGKGAALISAAQWAGCYGYTHIVTLDADGQHNPADAQQLLKRAKRTPLSIIVGKRIFPENSVPFSSRFGRTWSNLWYRITTGHKLADSQSGFRVYPVKAVLLVQCYGRRYDFEVEILVRSVWAGIPVTSTDISVHYSSATKEASHFDPLIDNYRVSVAYTRLVIRHFFPWPHRRLFKNSEDTSPRLSLFHPLRSLKILLQENTSPKDIVSASMLGVFLGTLPLIACHSVIIVFVATRLRLNRLVALSVSNICIPPLVPALALETGHYLRYGNFLTELNYQTLGREAPQRFFEYLIGSLVIGPILAAVVGLVVYSMISLFQNREPINGTGDTLEQ